MELIQKFKILVWAFAFLLLLNISTILLIMRKHKIHHPTTTQPIDTTCNDSFNHGQPPPPQPGLFTKIIIDELDLSNDQIQKFTALQLNFKNESHLKFDSIKFYNDLIDIQLKNDDINFAIVENYTKEIGNLHASLKLNFIYYFTDIQEILTEEQSTKLFTIFDEFRKQQRFNQNNRPNQNNRGYRNRQPMYPTNNH